MTHEQARQAEVDSKWTWRLMTVRDDRRGMRWKTYVFALLALLAGSSSWASNAPPIETSVCEINANPSKFEGLEVSIRGHVYAGVDITNISDPLCPGAMIQLSVGESTSGHRDIRSFEKGLRKYGMHAMATVTGRFQAKAPVFPYPMPAIDLHAVQRMVFEAK
jgi:hypothetical protein